MVIYLYGQQKVIEFPLLGCRASVQDGSIAVPVH
jgi:hypothetical protein